ncbi:MAG: hypothetical protein VX777_02215 [Chlamydiota bacterium]|nr:hypothetical protein [Chlamydiota bacterium]
MSSISSSNETPIVLEVEANLSDFDRGLQKLSDHFYTGSQNTEYRDIAKKLLDEGQEINERLEDLEKWEKKWKKGKVRGCVATVTILVVEAFAAAFTQFSDPENSTERNIGGGATTGIAVFALATGAFSLFAWWKCGRKYNKAREIRELSKDDMELISKMRIIIESIGAIDGSQNTGKPYAEIDEHRKNCFNAIKELPDNIEEKNLPGKSKLASLTVKVLSENLNENHPLNTNVKNIENISKQINGSDDNDDNFEDHGFKDDGQMGAKSFLGFSSRKNSLENSLAHGINNLQYNFMEGLYVDELTLPDGTVIKNPSEQTISTSDEISI